MFLFKRSVTKEEHVLYIFFKEISSTKKNNTQGIILIQENKTEFGL